MSDDALNKKIREAAEQYHPSYEEDAWEKMASLLDSQLPERKRRRRFFYLPLFLLLGGGAGLWYFYHAGPRTIGSRRIPGHSTALSKAQAPVPHHDVAGNNPIIVRQPGEPTGITRTPSSATMTGDVPAGHSGRLQPSTARVTIRTTGLSPQRRSSAAPLNGNTPSSPAETYSGAKAEETPALHSSPENNDGTRGDTTANRIHPPDGRDAAHNVPVTRDTQLTVAGKPVRDMHPVADAGKPSSGKKKQPGQGRFSRNFFITVSAGPDVSGVSMNRIGRMDLDYGIGLGYAVSPRWTIRAGFYVADKIYSADTSQYRIPYGGSSNYLSDVLANCIVYDIPLRVSYRLGGMKRHDWLVSAGLSSYLMKKEHYRYVYKYPSGYTDEKSWTIYNQNHHYFSVLDLSAAYEKRLGRKTSFLAEPYVQLPLAGVGAGKVRLGSGGVLFTLKIQPF